MIKYSFYLILFMATLSWSCNTNSVYEKNIDIENKSWQMEEIPTFSFNITDPEKRYNIYYNIRNSSAYPYQNLYVTYYLEDSTGSVLSSDLHNMDLFDAKTGKPKGKGLGDIFDHQFLALPGYKFEKAGVYHLKIQQFMRMENLPEILSVGLKVEKEEEN